MKVLFNFITRKIDFEFEGADCDIDDTEIWSQFLNVNHLVKNSLPALLVIVF